MRRAWHSPAIPECTASNNIDPPTTCCDTGYLNDFWKRLLFLQKRHRQWEAETPAVDVRVPLALAAKGGAG